jgi:2'-5' RNA ligase
VPYPFDWDTYVVLDVPEPVASKVIAARRRHGDVFRSALPAEITVAGSGGLGCVLPDQDPERVWGVLDEIAKANPPIDCALGEVLRFPNTDIFVYRPHPDDALRSLHEQLAASSIGFRPNPFPYTPHCTLRGGSPVTDEEAASLIAERIADRFTLDQLSVYRLKPWPSDDVPVICQLVRRWTLGSAGQ